MVEYFNEEAANKYIQDLRSEVILRDFESQLLLKRLQAEDEARRGDELPPERPSGARLLIFVCNPFGESPTHLLPNAIHDALAVNHALAADIVGGTSRTAVPADRDCTFARLREALTPTGSALPPWGFFFAGHASGAAGDETLRFTKTNGRFEDATSVDALVQALCTVEPPLELVFLNACNSLTIAQRIQATKRVGTVVCWSTPTIDAAAYLFARAFFWDCAEPQQGISGGFNYRRAFDAGCHEVKAQTRTVGSEIQLLYGLADPREHTALGDGRWAAGVPQLLCMDGSSVIGE